MSQLDYGLIGNCQISALVDKMGKIAWCGMPRLDSPSIFASLLDEQNGGFWSIEPADLLMQKWESKQAYIRNTNILVTTLEAADGSQFEIVDFVPRFEAGDGYYRPSQLVRVVRPIQGNPSIVVRCRPRFGYGKFAPRISTHSFGILYEIPEETLFLSTDAAYSYVQGEIPFELREPKHFALSYAVPFHGPLRFEVERQLQRTKDHWRFWAKHCSIPFEFQDEVLRSALTLKLHTFEDTGAIIAATTTSIPESPGKGRCWDYRYCWLRDAYFVVTALNQLGHFEEMEAFIRYLQNLSFSELPGNKQRSLQPVYGIGGESELEERELPWLTGFGGHGPVRVGNAAYKMEQHDVYGEMVLALTPTFFDRRLDRTDQARALRNVRQLLECAIQSFDLPDVGIWEFRGEKRNLLFSKLMNWAAVDRGVRIAHRIGRQDLAAEWVPIRDRMRQVIETRGWNESVGIYSQAFDGDVLDASSLLLPSVNFVPYTDPRFRRNLEACDRTLRSGKGVYRYRVADDFGVPKTSFTVCSFWMADALWGCGRKTEARDLFSTVISQANHVGLLSEDMDPETGELWGNFPQTYSHVGLINTAMRISQTWDDAF